jgi:hypothetical protein
MIIIEEKEEKAIVVAAAAAAAAVDITVDVVAAGEGRERSRLCLVLEGARED